LRLLVVLLLLAGGGCSNVFKPKHKLLVDSITAPGVPKPSGRSYRLIAKKSVVSQTQMQIPVVKACVDAALVGAGMFEAPPNSPPDYFVEVGFGVDAAGRTEPSSRETFVQLSARENPGRSLDRPTGAEVWDVRVAVLGIAGRVETAMPLLCSVAAGYIASDTRVETRVEVAQDDPHIAEVRQAAIKILEANAPKKLAEGDSAAAGEKPAPSPIPVPAK
jgi:hypothetical protein